jgi:multidrug efflux pump subunit AcrB
VTFARERRVAGDDRSTAIAGAARARLRPILMTSLAMIAGMIPMALGVGGAGEAAALGTAVIGGLTASTLASLLFLPPIYAILARGGAYRPPSLDPDDPQRTAHA